MRYQHSSGAAGGKQHVVLGHQVAPATHRPRQMQVTAIVDAVDTIGGRPGDDDWVLLADVQPGARHPAQRADDTAIAPGPAARGELICRTVVACGRRAARVMTDQASTCGRLPWSL